MAYCRHIIREAPSVSRWIPVVRSTLVVRLRIGAKTASRRCQPLAGGSSPDGAIVRLVVQNSKTESSVPTVPDGK